MSPFTSIEEEQVFAVLGPMPEPTPIDCMDMIVMYGAHKGYSFKERDQMTDILLRTFE